MNTSEPKVLELVVFKLRDGVSREEFLAANGAVSDWVSREPGFLSRELSYDADGDRWIDLLWWQSLEQAQAAAERALASESCAPMFSLLQMDSLLMLHGEPATAPVRAAAPVAA